MLLYYKKPTVNDENKFQEQNNSLRPTHIEMGVQRRNKFKTSKQLQYNERKHRAKYRITASAIADRFHFRVAHPFLLRFAMLLFSIRTIIIITA